MRHRVVFAANSNTVEGSGHLKRCIDFARTLDPQLFDCLFVGISETTWLNPLIAQFQREAYPLDKFVECDLLVLDTYQSPFIDHVLSKVRPKEILQIADPSTPLVKEGKILWLDTSLPPSSLTSRVVGSGLPFFPIRKIVSSPSPSRQAHNVVVVAGGTQQVDVLEKLLFFLQIQKLHDIRFHILAEYSKKLPSSSNFFYYPIGPHLYSLMEFCDTAISSSGVGVWELIANGINVGHFKFVSNQNSNFSYISSNNLGVPLSSDGHNYSRDGLLKLLRDENTRSKLFFKGLNHVKVGGSSRVAELISSLCS
jgi:spore coat polysaccharide biosynthesis predicted glycosyltransferase SpsG